MGQVEAVVRSAVMVFPAEPRSTSPDEHDVRVAARPATVKANSVFFMRLEAGPWAPRCSRDTTDRTPLILTIGAARAVEPEVPELDNGRTTSATLPSSGPSPPELPQPRQPVEVIGACPYPPPAVTLWREPSARPVGRAGAVGRLEIVVVDHAPAPVRLRP